MNRRSPRTRRVDLRTARLRLRLRVEPLEERRLLTTFTVVDTLDDANAGSLRWAINSVNSDPAATAAAPDTIAFNIPDSTVVHTITLSTALPILVNPVVIDGYTQPGSSANTAAAGDNAVLRVELVAGAPMNNALSLHAGSSTVRGLAIDRIAGGAAIALFVGGGDHVEGNFLGTDPTGMTSSGDMIEGVVSEGPGNTIGGTSPAQRNLISGISGKVSGVSGDGLYIADNAPSNVIEGNLIGTNAAGTAAIPNGVGVLILGPGDLIGGTAPGAGNTIAGNLQDDVGVDFYIFSGTNTTIQGNRIGTNAAGTAALGAPTEANVFLDGSSNNTIGGTTASARNVIAGGAKAIYIRVESYKVGANNVIQGNYIGTDPTGEVALGGGGVLIETSGNTIGGTVPGAGNLISGSTGIGLDFESASGHDNFNKDQQFDRNVVQGNFIGTDATGTMALGNAVGIGVGTAYGGEIVGGMTAGARNVISGNLGDGAAIGLGAVFQGNFVGTNAAGTAAVPNKKNGVVSSYSDAMVGPGNVISGNLGYGVELLGSIGAGTVVGNLIGTDASGTVALGNALGGVHTVATLAVTIGGPNPGDGNVISGNSGPGITIDQGSLFTFAENNLIGLAKDGTTALGNSGPGVLIARGSNKNFVGFQFKGATYPNTIGHNAGPGVSIVSGQDNVVQYNSIFGNAGPGIDLGGDGVTPNAPGSPHTGPNLLANHPVLAAVTPDPAGAGTIVSGTFNGIPCHQVTLDFYASAAADPSGSGPGQTPIGQISLATDEAGNADFNAPVAALPAGQTFVTATATDRGVYPPDTTKLVQDTSEFSAAVAAGPSASADLGVAVSVPAGPASAGQDLTYTITVTNHGTYAASNVIVVDTPPAGFTPVSTSGGGVAQCNGDQQFVIPTLAPGGTATVTVVVHPTAAATLTDKVTVSSGAADPNPADNAATLQTVVGPAVTASADLSIVVTAPTGPVPFGQDLTYTVTVTNHGSASAQGVEVVDTLPLGFHQVIAGAVQAGGVVRTQLGTVAPGAVATFTIVARPSGAGSFTNTAVVQSSTTGSTTANNTSTATSTVLPPVTPPPAADGPGVVGVRRYGYHAMPTTLRVVFNQALDPASAGNPSNYRITDSFGAIIAVNSASYNPAAHTVSLHPRSRLNLHRRYTLTVNGSTTGGVRGATGLLLDGAGTGRAGSNYAATVDAANLVVTNPFAAGARAARRLATRIRAAHAMRHHRR